MREIKVYDPTRRPPNWSEAIGRDEYAVFAKDVRSGATLDAEGRGFRAALDATCLVFKGLEEARKFCTAQVQRLPFLRLEIFDSEGRKHPPLLVVVHPDQQRTLPADPRTMLLRRRIAIGLVIAALPLLWADLWRASGMLIYPTLIGLNMMVVAARLVHLNSCARTAEEARQLRWAEALKRAG